LAAILACSAAFASSAYAQGHDRREHERERSHTPHWVLDDRFVAQPAMEPTIAQAPGGPPPSSSGSWYYCDPAKGYYPYVPECPAGWRTVPASPPQPK
jgi:hypothetical protein